MDSTFSNCQLICLPGVDFQTFYETVKIEDSSSFKNLNNLTDRIIVLIPDMLCRSIKQSLIEPEYTPHDFFGQVVEKDPGEPETDNGKPENTLKIRICKQLF